MDGILHWSDTDRDRAVTSACGWEGLGFDFQDWVLRFGAGDVEPVPVPQWFRWALKLGATLETDLVIQERKATLVLTTPCDSAIAGVIALGASLGFVPELRAPEDTANMFDQFMVAPPGTDIKRLPRGSETRSQSYRLLTERSEERGIAMKKLCERKKRLYFLTRPFANQFAFVKVGNAFDSEARSLAPHIGLSLFQSLLGEISSARDWRASSNSIALCAPALGAAALRSETDRIFFSDLIDECENEQGDEHSADLEPVRRLTLTDLLSVSQWQAYSDRDCPTHCQFVNASTTKPDDIPSKSKIVVFNGPDAYLRLNNRFMDQSHVVVVSRNADANKLERFLCVTHSVRDAAQPFVPSLPAPPFGIQLACLGDRRAGPKQW